MSKSLGTQLTSIFEGHHPKTRPFPIKPRAILVLGIHIYIYIIHIYINLGWRLYIHVF